MLNQESGLTLYNYCFQKISHLRYYKYMYKGIANIGDILDGKAIDNTMATTLSKLAIQVVDPVSFISHKTCLQTGKVYSPLYVYCCSVHESNTE